MARYLTWLPYTLGLAGLEHPGHWRVCAGENLSGHAAQLSAMIPCSATEEEEMLKRGGGEMSLYECKYLLISIFLDGVFTHTHTAQLEICLKLSRRNSM